MIIIIIDKVVDEDHEVRNLIAFNLNCICICITKLNLCNLRRKYSKFNKFSCRIYCITKVINFVSEIPSNRRYGHGIGSKKLDCI